MLEHTCHEGRDTSVLFTRKSSTVAVPGMRWLVLENICEWVNEQAGEQDKLPSLNLHLPFRNKSVGL